MFCAGRSPWLPMRPGFWRKMERKAAKKIRSAASDEEVSRQISCA
jgi:hypothetical protein